MKLIFAHTFYWVAVSNKRDEWHDRVQRYAETLKQANLVTTDEVLVEVLTFFAAYGVEGGTKQLQWFRRFLATLGFKSSSKVESRFWQGLICMQSV